MIDAAERGIRSINNATNCRNARAGWISFLESSNRALNRLESYAAKINKQAIYKEVLRELWNSSLASYMRLCRNTYEHGIIDIDVYDPYNERLKLPSGQIIGSPMVIGIDKDGNEVYMPPAEWGRHQVPPGTQVIRLRPTVRPVPIKDRHGKLIYPDIVLALQKEDEPEVSVFARLYLDWIKDRISLFD